MDRVIIFGTAYIEIFLLYIFIFQPQIENAINSVKRR